MKHFLLRALFTIAFCIPGLVTITAGTLVPDDSVMLARPEGFGRLLALGLPGGSYGFYEQEYPPMMFLKDDPSFMLANPALQSRYGNYVWGNVASSDGYGSQFIGGHLAFTKSFSLGIVASFDPYASGNIVMLRNQADEGFYLNNIAPGLFKTPQYSLIPEPNNALQVIASFGSGGTTYGVSVGYMNASFRDEDVPATGKTTFDDYSSMQLVGKFGMVMELDKKSSLDMYLHYGMSSVSFDYDRNVTGPAVPTFQQSTTLNSARLGGRYSMDMTRQLTWMLGLDAGYAWRSFSFDGFDASLVIDSLLPSRNTLAINLGTGVQYMIGRTLLTGGLNFIFTNNYTENSPGATFNNSEESETILVLPRLVLGAECRISDWLTGRVGYFRDMLYSSTTNTTISSGKTSENTISYAYAASSPWLSIFSNDTTQSKGLLTLGFGIHIERFSIDWAMSADVLRSLLKAELDAKKAAQVYVSVSYNLN